MSSATVKTANKAPGKTLIVEPGMSRTKKAMIGFFVVAILVTVAVLVWHFFFRDPCAKTENGMCFLHENKDCLSTGASKIENIETIAITQAQYDYINKYVESDIADVSNPVGQPMFFSLSNTQADKFIKDLPNFFKLVGEKTVLNIFKGDGLKMFFPVQLKEDKIGDTVFIKNTNVRSPEGKPLPATVVVLSKYSGKGPPKDYCKDAKEDTVAGGSIPKLPNNGTNQATTSSA